MQQNAREVGSAVAAVIIGRVIEQAGGVLAPVGYQRQITITKQYLRVTVGGRNQTGEQQGGNECED